MEILRWSTNEFINNNILIITTVSVYNNINGDIVVLPILDIVISISVSIINIDGQGIIILIYINSDIITLFISNPLIAIFIIFIISVLSAPAAINIDNNNIIISSVLNIVISIITYSKDDIIVIFIFSDTFTYSDINMNSEIIVIFILKIAIPVINISMKSYKYKIAVLSVIIIIINLTLIILLKNCKYKTVKIITIINIFFIDNNIIKLFTLNFNLKVTAVFLLKKCK